MHQETEHNDLEDVSLVAGWQLCNDPEPAKEVKLSEVI
jgi:hypothetical protein